MVNLAENIKNHILCEEAMNEEILDVVNDDDHVIGTCTRNELYEKKLTGRIVHVLVFNPKGDMLLQLRSRNVSYLPLHWSTSVGGHVQAGETYEQAAVREFNEELGAKANIEPFAKDVFVMHNGQKKMISIFNAVLSEDLEPECEDVEEVGFYSLDKIEEMMHSEKFHPELRFILEKYFF
jgi:isopentenyldiphosphate isomerase